MGGENRKFCGSADVKKKYFFTTPDPRSMISGTDSCKKNFFFTSPDPTHVFFIFFYMVGVDLKCNEM